MGPMEMEKQDGKSSKSKQEVAQPTSPTQNY